MLYEIITPDQAATAWNVTSEYPVATVSLDGAGIPPVVRREQPYANQHGALDYGFRLEPRELTLKLFYNAANKAAECTIRDTIYQIFQPFDNPLKLRCTRDDGTIRQIDCHTVGAMDLPESERIGASLAFAVRLRAPDPIWYYPTQQVHTYTPSAASGSSTTALTYTGGWDEYPIIKLYGLMNAVTLSTNIYDPSGTITYTLSIPSSVPVGDVWTIDLRPGYKTVTDSGGNNKMASLASVADNLSRWRLFPPPLKAGGINTLTLSYTSKNANAKVEVYYYNRFLGL